MKLVIGICLLAAMLWSARLWSINTGINPASAGFMVVGGLGIGLAAWAVRVWLRKRSRRRLSDMRDSALW